MSQSRLLERTHTEISAEQCGDVMEVGGEVGAHSVSSLPVGIERRFRRESSCLQTWKGTKA